MTTQTMMSLGLVRELLETYGYNLKDNAHGSGYNCQASKFSLLIMPFDLEGDFVLSVFYKLSCGTRYGYIKSLEALIKFLYKQEDK